METGGEKAAFDIRGEVGDVPFISLIFVAIGMDSYGVEPSRQLSIVNLDSV